MMMVRLRNGGVVRLRYSGILATGAYTYGPRMSSCGYDGRLRLGSVVRLRDSHGTVKLRCGHMVRLRDYGTPTEGSRLRRDYSWVLLKLRLRRNYGGLLRSCSKEEA